MIEFIIAIIMASACHNPKCTHSFKEHLAVMMTMGDEDTGGQTGHPPPPPPPPPPPGN